MSAPRFLIGRGELLTRDIGPPKRRPDKAEAYTFTEARARLAPQFENVAAALGRLPDQACPDDYGVARIVMNPSYIARSYFPTGLLRATKLESIGSRMTTVRPEHWTRKGEPRDSATTELFVAGQRDAFRRLPAEMDGLEPGPALDLAHLETVSSLTAADRVVDAGTAANQHFEIGVHLLPGRPAQFVQNAFVEYAATLGVQVMSGLAFTAGTLWFVPVACEQAKIHALAEFVFVRVARPVPPLRGLPPPYRGGGPRVACHLPVEQALSSEPRVAVIDGGLPAEHPIGRWLGAYRELDVTADDDPAALEHGLAVTSAILFGPIRPHGTAARPYAPVDHLRVLDRDTGGEDPLELYRTLGLIEQTLLARQYQFVNLSLGPELSVEDDDVHAWTSVIDDLLSDGDTLMTIAAGNNGERDRAAGLARVQVPADCVNALAVGAADDLGSVWTRASYSAIGPGRSPGVVKPDLVAFGGDPSHYFHALVPGTAPELAPTQGTSYAAPYLLRSAVGVGAILGTDLSPLAIKALLVHAATDAGNPRDEIGWGKPPEDLNELITCADGVARVVYQGELKPGKYLRAPLPLPDGSLTGMVDLRATFCYASPTDPQEAAAYTRAGLDVVFRPHAARRRHGGSNADSRGFFSPPPYATEAELRGDFGKWETTLHGNTRMRGSSLHLPVFDIHYNARDGGGPTTSADKIRYALILTVEAPKRTTLYQDILDAYAGTLVPIEPKVSVPIRV